MKKKNIMRIAVFFLVGTILVSYSMIRAAASESNVSFQGNSKEIVMLPEKDLFNNFKAIMPGAVVSQPIKLMNNSEETLTLSLRAQSASLDQFDGNEKKQTISNELLEKLELILTKTSNGQSEIIYSGPLSGKTNGKAGETGSMTKAISLGSYEKNAGTEITATLKVPGEIGDKYQNAEAKINWVFSVEGIDPSTSGIVSEPTKGEDVPMNGLPLTGDTANLIWIAAIIAVVSAGAVFVVLKVRKTDKKQ